MCSLSLPWTDLSFATGMMIRPRIGSLGWLEIDYMMEDTETWDMYVQALDEFLSRKLQSTVNLWLQFVFNTTYSRDRKELFCIFGIAYILRHSLASVQFIEKKRFFFVCFLIRLQQFIQHIIHMC